MGSRTSRSGPARTGTLRPRQPSFEPTPLFPVETHSAQAGQPSVAPALEPRELWVGVHLPWFALEALGSPSGVAGNQKRSRPCAIIELQGQTQFVIAVCEVAASFGVRPGMSMAAALALIPPLETRQREIEREKRLLERLAAQAQRFTPRVSLVPPDGLVLEVKGSLHLFGGAKALCRTLEREFQGAGVKPLLSLAPAPLAALAGARAGRAFIVTQPAHLIGHLASLPLATLRWPLDVLQRLKQVGVYTVGAALRLPRAGFARRFGKAQLAMLDRIAGRQADLRAAFKAPERFKRRQALLYELEHHESILAMLAPLLQELGEFLKARQCGITRLDCLLIHRHAAPTKCVLRLAAPASSAQHLTKLLGERLSALSLPEAVRACELRSGALVSQAPTTNALWQAGEHGGRAAAGPLAESRARPRVGSRVGLRTGSGAGSRAESWAQSAAHSWEIIEHLRSRLGHEAVYGLKVLASHRPETAWTATALDTGHAPAAEKSSPPASQSVMQTPWSVFRRPAWLLPAPRPLREKQGWPYRHGLLALLRGPERIESGWWDGGHVARDYYLARDVRGVCLWIFRERNSPHRWFLHGVFG